MSLEAPHHIDLRCFKLKQPIGEFFVCKIRARELCQITYFDIRRMTGENEIDEYIGIQRHVDKRRVAEIQSYVNTSDACFPSSIVLAVDSRCAEFINDDTLRLSNDPNPEEEETPIYFRQIARVIDGQHRIEGLRGLKENEDFEVTISVFVGLDIEDQAFIFSTVNLAQTKVNKSLVYDLYDFARFRSPQRTCHNIVIAFDRRQGSPFEGRIKRLGNATKGRLNQTITQAAFVESLMPYISDNPAVDRDELKRGRKLPRVDKDVLKRVIFRNLFAEERDTDIALIVYAYFMAARSRWPRAWASTDPGAVLSRTNGFRALMRFLKPAYRCVSQEKEIPTEAAFSRIFEKINLHDEDFNVDRFVPGTSGEAELFRTFLNGSNLSNLA